MEVNVENIKGTKNKSHLSTVSYTCTYTHINIWTYTYTLVTSSTEIERHFTFSSHIWMVYFATMPVNSF